jgi:hypothetical protein
VIYFDVYDPRQEEYRARHLEGLLIEVRLDSPPTIPDAEVLRLELIDRERAPICERPGCTNTLTGRQEMFCSTKCSGAARQQRYRNLAKLELHDVDLISQAVDDPQDFRREAARARRLAARPVELGEGVTVDREILEVFNASTRR